METIIGQVVRAASVSAQDASTFIQQWDLSTGVSLGMAHKEVGNESGTDALPIAIFPTSMKLETGGLVSYNAKNSSLNYFQAGKERAVHRFFGQERISALYVTNCGSYLWVGTEEGKLLLWEIHSGTLLVALEGAHYQRITAVGGNADAMLLFSASADGTVKVWSWIALLSQEYQPLYSLSEATAAVTDIHIGFGIDSNFRMIASSADGRIRFYDMIDGQILATFEFPTPINKVKMTADETIIIGGGANGCIYLIDLASDASELAIQNAPQYTPSQETTNLCLSGHSAAISALALSLDETILVSADVEGSIILWNLHSRQIIRRLRGSGAIRWLDVSCKATLDHRGSELFVAQPKRTLSSHPSLFSSLRTPSCTSSSDSHIGQTCTVEGSSDVDLRRTYSRLLDVVFTRFN